MGGVHCQHGHAPLQGIAGGDTAIHVGRKGEGLKLMLFHKDSSNLPQWGKPLRKLSDLSYENIEFKKSTELVEVFYMCMLIKIE